VSRIAIACALCLLLAGCTAPTARQTTADAGTPDTIDSGPTGGNETDAGSPDRGVNESRIEHLDIPVRGGSLPVEHERIFARTTDVLGADVAPPSVIVVRSAAEIRSDTGGPPTAGSESRTRSFGEVMGIGGERGESGESDDGTSDESDGTSDESDENDEADEGVSVAAYAPSADSVVVNERMTAAGREQVLERTMAHEFVHNVQFRQSAFLRTQRALDADRTPTRDTYLTYSSVIEGAAVFVAETYDRRYLAGDWASITTTERYRSASAGVKYSISRYYFGHRYLRHRYDSARNLSAVYDDPPRTTEQLVHNDTDGSEVPKELALSVEPGENRTPGRTNTYGELFARIALGTELNESRAADAAAGWGADRLVPVDGENGTRSYVWTTRWDLPSEADEFAAATESYFRSRAERSAASVGARADGATGMEVNRSATDSPTVWRDGELFFRTVRTSDESVVLLAGTESFVRDASAFGTNASVSVVARGDDRR
jgi:hypothetical protein